MKSGCESRKVGRSVALPVLKDPQPQKSEIRNSKTGRWRAGVLIAVNLVMVAHFIQWYFAGNTLSPIEPSETMYTLERGAINAGMIFFVLAITATLIFGRFVCGWGCHIVALQDFCAWLLKKIGIAPRPFRSRLLVYVPLAAALYMFVFPTALRFLAAPKSEPLFPKFTNHLTTTEFWATFPPVAVAIPFLFICGFLIVYFLGSKGFCTYACPYGGVFGVIDKLSPGKIRVTDACNQCGHCTATCTSNVLVHSEVAKYGMVVDPGCMKCMDCVSVCPNDALYFGFGRPSIITGKNPNGSESNAGKNFSLTWPEEIAGAVIFLAGFLAVWDVYQLVPMLMALGIAAITAFLSLRVWKLFRTADSAFLRFSLKSSGRITRAGWIFLSFALIWIGLNAHSGWIRYHERAGLSAFQKIQVYDELALARPNPKAWLSAADRENVTQGLRHLHTAADFGLFTNSDVLPKLAWLEYLSGDADKAVQQLGKAANREQRQARALSLYYRGAILNRLRNYDEALSDLDQALNEAPDLILAREERGESLWQLGRKEEAISVWNDAVRLNNDLPLANYLLAAAAASQGLNEAAATYETQAELSTPDDAAFHYMIGLRLENLRFNASAEKHFQRAIQLDPQLRARRNLDLLNRF